MPQPPSDPSVSRPPAPAAFVDRFEAPTEGVRLVPVCRRLLSDSLTPVLAYRRLVRPDERQAPSYLFESVVDGDRVGRYSFLGSRPAAEVVARGHEVVYRDHLFPQNSRTYRCDCLLYTSPSPRDQRGSRMPSSA